MRFKSETRQLESLYNHNKLPDLFKNKRLLNRFTDLSQENSDDTMFAIISEMIDFNLMQDQSKLQNKIDYYITPYNKNENFQPMMKFGDKLKYCKNMKEAAKKEWKMLSDYILKTDKGQLRSNLNKVNREMYDKLKELAVAEIGKSSLSSSRKDSSSVRNQPLLRMKTKKNSNGFIPAKKNLSSS